MSSDQGLDVDKQHWSIVFLSIARLDRYLRRREGNFEKALADYAADLKALADLMILINVAEVAIRNTVVSALQARYGTAESPWYEGVGDLLTPLGKKSLEDTKKRIRSEGRRVTSATVTAGLTLGFWVSLFGGNYEPTLWTQALKNAFVGETVLNRGKVHRQLNRLLKIRNVAAHHGLVLRDDLAKHRESILTLVFWISPEGHQWVLDSIKP
jgi:hypothetical protein